MGKRALAVEPRGGQRQKARWAAEEAAPAAALAKSKLATYLIDRWAWGELSTPVVQQIAAAAAADGASHPDVIFLASLGSSGRYPRNCYRELTHKLVPTPLVDSIDVFNVWQKRSGKPPILASQEIMLPHRVFSCLYHNHHDVFKDNIWGGSLDEPSRFWKAVENTDTYKNHPVSRRESHRQKAIPIGLHGDAVTTSGVGKSWAKGCDAYSWRSILARTSQAITSNFLIWLFLQSWWFIQGT